ncbi:MAG: HAMP domain-containing sensor histidine kinase [Pseudomonadota bacterium]
MDPAMIAKLKEAFGGELSADMLNKLWTTYSDEDGDQSLETLGELTAGIAHEINTPIQYVTDNVKYMQDATSQLLAVLATYQELLRDIPEPLQDKVGSAMAKHAVTDDDLDFMREELPEAAEQALTGLEQVIKIVSSVKSFAFPTGKDIVYADLGDIINATATVSRNEWKYLATLEVVVDQTIGLVPCYPGEIHQVLLNLIINAAHAIEDNKSRQLGMILVQARARGDFVEIMVSDDGCGVAEVNAAKIMEPFFTTKKAGRGSGQGLALSKKIVEESHNGTLSFQTAPDVGTTFIIRLPLIHAKGETEAA